MPEMTWWNVSYYYAQYSTVTNPGSSIIFINLNNNTGTSNTTTIFSGGTFLSNFNSTRFVVDNTTLIPFYINNISNGVANVSVNVSIVGAGQSVGFYWTDKTDYNSASNLSDTFTTNTNLSTFTETDPSSQLVINNATKLTITNQVSSNSYIRKDYGAGYFSGDQVTKFDFMITSNSGSADSSHWLWVEGNVADTTGYPVSPNTGLFWNAATGQFSVMFNGSNIDGGHGALNVRYYLTVTRIAGVTSWVFRTGSHTGTIFYSYSQATDSVAYRYMTLAYLGGHTYQITGDIQNLIHYKVSSPNPTWAGWSTTNNILISSYSNNYTNNNSLNFSIPQNTAINFSSVGSGGVNIDSNTWYINGVNQGQNTNYFNKYITAVGTTNITLVATNTTYGASSSISWFVSLAFTLSNPGNQSTVYKSYPPQTTNVNFTWNIVETEQYELKVAKDMNFNLMEADAFLSVPYNIVGLGSGVYYWRVYSYNATTRTSYNSSVIQNFTIVDNQTSLGTAIQGIVYKLVDGVPIPISGATVYIYNSAATYSNTLTVGSNGYFLFTGLIANTTYALRATKSDEYDDSQVVYVTTTLSNTSTQNILMQPCVVSYNCYVNIVKMRINLHYYNGTPAAGITANVYKYGELPLISFGTTGESGTVVFSLIKTQKYRIVFVNSTGTMYTWEDYPLDVLDVEVGTWVIETPTAPAAINISTGGGNYGWNLSDYTGANLTSRIGLGVKGQGVIIAALSLWLIPIGGAMATGTIMAGFGLFGIISPKFIILMILTYVAWYVVKRELS